MEKTEKEPLLNAIMGQGTLFSGTLEFEGTIRLDGEVKGNIFSPKGTLVIGETALITADIFVRVALILGNVVGSVRAVERIELHPPARISGDISAKIIKIDAGARFVGNCSMSSFENIGINSVRFEDYDAIEPQLRRQKKL